MFVFVQLIGSTTERFVRKNPYAESVFRMCSWFLLTICTTSLLTSRDRILSRLAGGAIRIQIQTFKEDALWAARGARRLDAGADRGAKQRVAADEAFDRSFSAATR